MEQFLSAPLCSCRGPESPCPPLLHRRVFSEALSRKQPFPQAPTPAPLHSPTHCRTGPNGICLSVFAEGDEVIALNMIKSAPVGPVAGGIMGCIMVLVLAVYAYRHQIHRRSHQHMSPLAAQGTCRVA